LDTAGMETILLICFPGHAYAKPDIAVK
jgi:hypothetical protein